MTGERRADRLPCGSSQPSGSPGPGTPGETVDAKAAHDHRRSARAREIPPVPGDVPASLECRDRGLPFARSRRRLRGPLDPVRAEEPRGLDARGREPGPPGPDEDPQREARVAREAPRRVRGADAPALHRRRPLGRPRPRNGRRRRPHDPSGGQRQPHARRSSKRRPAGASSSPAASDTVEKKLSFQADQLALTPTLAPAVGVLTAGFGLRVGPIHGAAGVPHRHRHLLADGRNGSSPPRAAPSSGSAGATATGGSSRSPTGSASGRSTRTSRRPASPRASASAGATSSASSAPRAARRVRTFTTRSRSAAGR